MNLGIYETIESLLLSVSPTIHIAIVSYCIFMKKYVYESGNTNFNILQGFRINFEEKNTWNHKSK